MFSGKFTSEATIADVLDKGSGAVILLDGEFYKCYHIIFIPYSLIFISSMFLFMQVASQAVNLLLLIQPVSAGIEIMD